MGAAEVVSNGMNRPLRSGSGPIGFILEVSSVPAVMDLPTLDALRDEQRSLRAQLARLRGRLHLQLLLELATDAVIVLTATAAALVFLDWLFRFGLPVRLVLLTLCLVGVLGVPGRSRVPEVASVAARRAVTGGDARSLPAGGRAADRRRAPAPRPAGRARGVGLAGHGAVGRSTGVRGPGRVRLAIALEPEADGPARRRPCSWA